MTSSTSTRTMTSSLSLNRLTLRLIKQLQDEYQKGQSLWPFWYSSCNCFISLRVKRFNENDDVIVRVDVELVMSFLVKKFYEIERKDKINDRFWWGLFYFRARMRNTGGSLRRPKKSKEILTHECRSMESWDGPKFETLIFSFISNRNINHVSKS